MSRPLDLLDLSILKLALERPKAGVREYARVPGAARGTIQSRLDRILRRGVMSGYEPRISPAGLGFPAFAYVRLNLAQGVLDEVTHKLVLIPEVIQVAHVGRTPGFGRFRPMPAGQQKPARFLRSQRSRAVFALCGR